MDESDSGVLGSFDPNTIESGLFQCETKFRYIAPGFSAVITFANLYILSPGCDVRYREGKNSEHIRKNLFHAVGDKEVIA